MMVIQYIQPQPRVHLMLSEDMALDHLESTVSMQARIGLCSPQGWLVR